MVRPPQVRRLWIDVLLVVLAPVTPKHRSRMFVLMEDFTIDGPDDTVFKTIHNM